jgi:hypothetical protein
MTADPHLTHSAIVDVVIHVSEIVCLEPGWTLPVPLHPAAARSASRSCRHCTDPKRPECARPNIVESGL